MNLFPSLFHDSGGVVYHWRALFHSRKLWENHQQNTRRFLEEWNPQSKHLVLIGPAGGYSLPVDWLKKFTRVEAYEPDPLSRKIFELRTGIKPHWHKEPFRFEDVQSGSIHFEPDSAILFCNLLGQLHFDEDSGLRAQEVLCQLAEWHELASYHDIVSGDYFRFEWSSPTIGSEPLRVKYEAESLDPYFAPFEGVTELDLHVHPAAYLFQDDHFKYQYWEWQITGKQIQVIEAVYSRPTS